MHDSASVSEVALSAMKGVIDLNAAATAMCMYKSMMIPQISEKLLQTAYAE